jgi:hypothetical protein
VDTQPNVTHIKLAEELSTQISTPNNTMMNKNILQQGGNSEPSRKKFRTSYTRSE